ncbi:MAG: hypothetical protein H0T91_11155 [Propionibacteriaceae bacterium]|nr:hypothetical protein [Propionibacteriaceae bacterium]
MTDPLTLDPAVSTHPRPSWVLLFRTLVEKVIGEPVRNGRLREVGWPYGLRGIVGLGCAVYALGAVVVIFSSLIRRSGELSVATTLAASIPRGYVWLLLFMVLIALAMFQTAALHTAWWLRLVGVLTSVVVMGTWGFRYSSMIGGGLETVLTGLLMLGLIVLVVLRARKPFAWWEFPTVLLLLGSPIVIGMAFLSRSSRPLGYDFVPVFLQTTVTSLGPVALPAAVAAGLSVAEITVSATLWATRLTERFAARRVAYVILAVLVVLRLVQAIWQVATWDFIRQGWSVFLTWVLLSALLGLLSAAVIRLGQHRASMVVSELPGRMAGMALPLGVAMVGVAFGAVIVISVFGIVAALDPARFGASSASWLGLFTSVNGPNLFRSALGVVLVGLAVRSARRGSTATALLLCAVAVMLWARVVRWVTGGLLNAGFGADALNLVATVLLLALIAFYLIRRALTRQRALALSGALVLSALLGYHDFVSDPLGALLGFSGAALVLFGLTWDLLTDSDFANRDSRRFPLPSRVMLLFANVVLAIAILAYTSLVRDPTATINLNEFAALGDEVLGTALLAAAFIGVLSAVRNGRSVD